MGLRTPTGWCDLEGARVAWKSTGDSKGRAVVCLHSQGGGSRDFRPLLDHLPAGMRLVTFDWPGHGRSRGAVPSSQSSVPLLFQLLNNLGIARPILLGSGFGAAVAVRFASAHPMRALGLVLVQPAELFPLAWNPIHPLRVWLSQAMHRGSVKTGSESDWQRARLDVIRRLHRGREESASKYGKREEAQTALDFNLRNLPCPALFAFSRQNRDYSLRRYMQILDPLLAASPQHRFTVFSGNFNPIWDEPARFSKALNGFVQSLLPFKEHRHAWLLSAVDWPAKGHNMWKCVHPHCAKELIIPVGQDANGPNATSVSERPGN